MKCPKCKEGELYFTRTLEKQKFQRYKILNYFCPLCGWIKMFKIKLTRKEFKREEDKESQIYKL